MIAHFNIKEQGGECHTPDEWRSKIDAICRLHNVEGDKSKILTCVDIAAKWLIDNPDVVTETK